MMRSCGECYAVVAPQHVEQHRLWHSSMAPTMRAAERFRDVTGEELMVPLHVPNATPGRRLDYPNPDCAKGDHLVEPSSTLCVRCKVEAV